MNDTRKNDGGWPATSLRIFVNNDIYNAIPSEIKNAIIDTIVVSGHGPNDAANFTSTDKLYLLAPKEIYSDWSTYQHANDTAKDLTRTLDYYTSIGVTTGNYSGAIKKNGTSASTWWLREAEPYDIYYFYYVTDGGNIGSNFTSDTSDAAPAFRLG